MAINDNTSYELTGAQVKDLANKIKGKAADNIFVGATSAAPGSKGLVPQPQAGDDTKYLKGDGSWGVPTSFIPDYGAAPTTETSPYTSTAHQFVRITTNGGAIAQINDKQVIENGNNGHFWFEIANGDIVKVLSGAATIYSWPGRWV